MFEHTNRQTDIVNFFCPNVQYSFIFGYILKKNISMNPLNLPEVIKLELPQSVEYCRSYGCSNIQTDIQICVRTYKRTCELMFEHTNRQTDIVNFFCPNVQYSFIFGYILKKNISMNPLNLPEVIKLELPQSVEYCRSYGCSNIQTDIRTNKRTSEFII